MRRSVYRTLSAVLMFSASILPVSFFGQNQDSKKATPSSGKTAPESGLLKADEGPGLKVKRQIRKRRLAPGLGSTGEDDPSPVEIPSFRVISQPREGRLQRGKSFQGDLRALPQVPPEKFERPER